MPAPDQNFRIKRFSSSGHASGSTTTFWTETVPSGRQWQIVSWFTTEVSGTDVGTINLDMSSDGTNWIKLEDQFSDTDLNIIAHLTEGDQLRLRLSATGDGSATWNSLVSYREYRSVAVNP